MEWTNEKKFVLAMHWNSGFSKVGVVDYRTLVCVQDKDSIAHEYIDEVKIIDRTIKDFVLIEDSDVTRNTLVWRPLAETGLFSRVVDHDKHAMLQFRIFMENCKILP